MARSDNPPTSGLLRWLPFRLDRGVGVAVGAGVVLALTGAFGTDIVPLWLRVAYWVPLILAGWRSTPDSARLRLARELLTRYTGLRPAIER